LLLLLKTDVIVLTVQRVQSGSTQKRDVPQQPILIAKRALPVPLGSLLNVHATQMARIHSAKRAVLA
jgi:hypothetical protein